MAFVRAAWLFLACMFFLTSHRLSLIYNLTWEVHVRDELHNCCLGNKGVISSVGVFDKTSWRVRRPAIVGVVICIGLWSVIINSRNYTNNALFLGAFAELRKWLFASSCVCLSVPPSFCSRGTTLFPLDGFLWNMMFEYFFENLSRKFKFH